MAENYYEAPKTECSPPPKKRHVFRVAFAVQMLEFFGVFVAVPSAVMVMFGLHAIFNVDPVHPSSAPVLVCLVAVLVCGIGFWIVRTGNSIRKFNPKSRKPALFQLGLAILIGLSGVFFGLDDWPVFILVPIGAIIASIYTACFLIIYDNFDSQYCLERDSPSQ